jgi:hypothetical protein
MMMGVCWIVITQFYMNCKKNAPSLYPKDINADIVSSRIEELKEDEHRLPLIIAVAKLEREERLAVFQPMTQSITTPSIYHPVLRLAYCA